MLRLQRAHRHHDVHDRGEVGDSNLPLAVDGAPGVQRRHVDLCSSRQCSGRTGSVRLNWSSTPEASRAPRQPAHPLICKPAATAGPQCSAHSLTADHPLDAHRVWELDGKASPRGDAKHVLGLPVQPILPGPPLTGCLGLKVVVCRQAGGRAGGAGGRASKGGWMAGRQADIQCKGWMPNN